MINFQEEKADRLNDMVSFSIVSLEGNIDTARTGIHYLRYLTIYQRDMPIRIFKIGKSIFGIIYL